MRHPLSYVAGGIALVVVDFRAESLDLLPDPVGWLLIAMGAATLSLRTAAWGSGLAALLSVSDAYLPYRYSLIDPRTNEPIDACPVLEDCPERITFDAVTGWRLVVFAGAVVVGAVAVGAVLRGLRRRAIADGDRTAATRLSLLTWVVLAAWAVPQVLGLAWVVRSAPRRFDPVWNGGAEYVALIGWVAVGWLIVELCLWVRRGWALPDGHVIESPWADLMLRDDQPEGY